MLDNLYFKLLTLAPPESAFLAVTGVSVDVGELLAEVVNRACAFLMASAILLAGWRIAEAHFDHSPSARKKGYTTIIGGTLMASLIYEIYNLMFA